MEEERGLSFGEILKIIFKRVWWLLGATALCLIAVVLITQLWYNKKVQYFSVSYELVYPDSESGRYPDNSYLLAADCISFGTLNDIKNGKYSPDNPEEFKSIDVDKMLKKDGISISETVTRTADDGIKRTYTLTVIADYFSSNTQAANFLRTVASYPVYRVNEIIASNEYGKYFSIFDKAETYADKIDALLRQKQYLEEKYNSFVIYGSEVEANSAALHNIFTETQRQSLEASLTANYYVVNAEEYLANSDTRIAALNKKISDNNAIISELEKKRDESATTNPDGGASAASVRLNDQGIITSPYDYEIALLTKENGVMLNEIADIEATKEAIGKYSQEGTAAYGQWNKFESQLNGYRAELEEATAALKKVSTDIYKNNSRVIFSVNSIKTQGGINAVIAAILGALIGLLVTSFIIAIIDVPRYKRKMLAQAAAENAENKVSEEENAEVEE